MNRTLLSACRQLICPHALIGILILIPMAMLGGCSSHLPAGEDLAETLGSSPREARMRLSTTPGRPSAGDEEQTRPSRTFRDRPLPSSASQEQLAALSENTKGWSFVAEKLRKDGVPESEILAAIDSPDVPPFDFVPFSLRPKESKSLYKGATKPEMVAIAIDGINSNYAIFAEMERRYDVDRAVVAAILTIESKFGRFTGKHSVFYRLLRLVTTNDPNNVRWNYSRLKDEDPSTQMQEVVERGQYLERTFYPELLAVFEICRREGLQVHDLRGSIAGAFGLSQFMPRSYLAFSVDGNRNGRVSLYEPEDAIMSVGNFLHQHGWKHQATREQKRRAIWGYNKSEAYIDAVFGLASLIERVLARGNIRNQAHHAQEERRPETSRPSQGSNRSQQPPNRPEGYAAPGSGDEGSDESGFIELDDLY